MSERTKKQIQRVIAVALALFTVVNTTVEISAHNEPGREIYSVAEEDLLEQEEVEEVITPEQVDSGLPMYYEPGSSDMVEESVPEEYVEEQEEATEQQPEGLDSELLDAQAEAAGIPEEEPTASPSASPTPQKELTKEAELTVNASSFGSGSVSASFEDVVLSEDAALTFGSADVDDSAFIDAMNAASLGNVLAIKTMDISLLGENGKVALESGQIKITLTFNTPLFAELGDITNVYYQVLHLTGSGVEVLATQKAGSAGLRSITFITSSFSPYAIVAVGSEDSTVPTASPEVSPSASPEVSPSASPSASPDGKEDESDSFTFNENGIHASATLNGGETLPSDVKFRVDPSGFGGKDGGALSAVESYLAAQGQEFVDGGVFDVYFWDWNKNKAVDPKEGAYVTVNFDRGVYVGGMQTAVRLFQVTGGSVTELGGSVSRNGDGSVNGISLNLNYFDLIVVAGVASEDGESELIETEDAEQQLTEQSIAVHTSDDGWVYVKGLLPEGATVTAIPTSVQVEGKKVLAAYDITIWDGAGNEYTITEAVTVSITAPSLKKSNAGKVEIYHKEDGSSAVEKVADADVDYNKVSFEAHGFSTYIVTDEETGSVVIPTYDLSDPGVATINVKVETNNAEIQPETSYPINSTFKLVLDYEISNTLINSIRDLIEKDEEGSIDFSYQMPSEAIGAMPADSGKIFDSSTNLECGTYTVDSSGRVLFRFDKSYIKNGSDIKGTFNYWFKISEEQNAGKEEVSFRFPGIAEPIKIQITTADTTGWKYCGSYNAETGTIPFSIDLNTGAYCAELVIKDTPESNLVIQTGTIEVRVNDVLQSSTDLWSLDENGGFTITLKEVPKGASVKVNYDAKIKDTTLVENGKVTGLKNTASWTANGKTYSSETYPSVSQANNGSKYGYASGQLAKWVVDINNGSMRADVSGKVYTDTLGSGQEYVKESLKIYEEGVDVTDSFAGTLTWTGDSSFSVTLPGAENGTNTKAYKITYDTKPTETLNVGGTVTLTNQGSFGGDSFGGEVTINRSDETKVSKATVGYPDNKGVVEWQAVITPDTLIGLSEIRFEDFLGSVDWEGKKTSWTGSVFLEDSVEVSGADGLSYTVTFANSVNSDASGHDTMVIVFSGINSPVTSPITITYKSQNTKDATNGINIDNYCWLNDHYTAWCSAWYKDQVTGAAGIYKEAWEPYDNNGYKAINWVIKANAVNDSPLDDFHGKTMVITDTLPEGMGYAGEYQCGSTVEKSVGNTYWQEPREANVAVSGRTVTITVPNVGKELIWVRLLTKITDLQYDHTYTNLASYGVEGEEPLGSAEADAVIKSNILEKSGTVPADDKTKIQYTITVNKDSANYLPGEGDYLILEDTIPENVDLVNGSIIFEDGNGGAVPDASYLYDTSTRLLRVQVPDEKKVLVKYAVRPKLDGLSSSDGHYWVEVSNTVVLSGNANTSAGGSNWYEIVDSGASVTRNQQSLTIQKLDAQDTGKGLAGAVFELYAVNLDGSVSGPVSMTTDANGMIVYGPDSDGEGGIATDTVYYYQETKAPEGYVLDSTKHYFIYKGNSAQTAIDAFRANYPNETLKESAGGDFVTVTNFQNPNAVIEATKNLDGRDLKEGEFTFILTESDSSGNALEGGAIYTAKNGADGSVRFPEITYSGTETHYYRLEEKQESLPHVTYDDKVYLVTVTITQNSLLNAYIPTVSYALLGGSSVGTAAFNNTYLPTTSKTVNKVWVDGETTHPEVTVQLKQNNTIYGSVTLPQDGQWTYTWDNLPLLDADKNTISYTVEEVVPEGYKGSTSVSGDTTTITNTKLTSISGEKIWKDDDNRDGIRPTEITVELMAGDVPLNQTASVSDANDWTYTFTDLPLCAPNGTKYDYWVKEQAVEGYTTTGGKQDADYNITNTHEPEETSVEVNKEWVDGNNQDGLRKPVTVYLLADGSRVKIKDQNGNDTEQDMSLVLNEGNWSGSFTNLPKNNGKNNPITYTVEEVQVEGYTTNITGGKNEDGTFTYTITNSHTPEEVRVEVNKEWADGDNRDGKRPGAQTGITVVLSAKNGEVESQQKVMTPVVENGVEIWHCTFENLPKYYTGNNGTSEIEYVVSEIVPEGYTPSYAGPSYRESDKTYSWTITNTYNPEETGLTVIKSWADGNNQDGLRPDSISVQLYADGSPYGEPVALSGSDNNWSYTWTELPKNRNTGIGATEIKYTVDEVAYTKDGVTAAMETGDVPFEGYTKTITVDGDQNMVTITNTHEPAQFNVQVTKKWEDGSDQDGVRPNVTINLYGKIGDEIVETREVTFEKTTQEGDTWSHTFENLPKYKGGQEITYSVEEGALDESLNYEVPVITGDVEKGFVVTNKRTPEEVEISGEKTWIDAGNEDKRPENITVHLWGNNEEIADQTVSAEDNWSWNFGTLPKYKGGEEIQYTVTEDAVLNYTRTDNGEGLNVTNKYTPGATSRTVVKVWNDNNNQDGLREPVFVQLIQGSGDSAVAYGEAQELTASNNWSYTWSGLPSVTDEGATIQYSIQEISKVEGYETAYNTSGTTFTITNTHEPETTSISGEKVWNDNKNQDGIRPAGITISIWNGETKVKDVSVSGDSTADRWSWSSGELPKYQTVEGVTTEISYTVTETQVSGYETPVVEGYTITNTHTPATIGISGSKTWVDKGEETRPQSITIYLMNGEQVVESKEITATDKWQWTFENLPEKAGGIPIEYKVREESVADYSTAYADNGRDVTNTYTPGYTSRTVTKVWNDDNDREVKRPQSIQVQLKENGVARGDEVTLNELNGWTYTWSDLPVNKDGEAVVYTVEEVGAVGGYITTYSEDTFTITNTHSIETVSVRGEKTWINTSEENRPEFIIINLLADGIKVDSKEVRAPWRWEFTDKPKYKNVNGVKTAIAYAITEESMTDFITEVNGYDVTNIYNKTQKTVKKAWDDNDSTNRPEAVSVQLLANGQPQGDKITLNAANGWEYTWTGLEYWDVEKEKAIEYSVVETEIPEGYEDSYLTEGAVITITNKLTVIPTPTPTATPEATPSATPEATPTATPETTPTATPGTTPEPTATPGTEPTATPETEVTPAPTPETVIEPTPTVNPVIPPAETPEPVNVLGGARVKASGMEAAVLGARRGREAAVLGARRRPSTGDSIAILVWMLMLGLSIGTAISSAIMMKYKKDKK